MELFSVLWLIALFAVLGALFWAVAIWVWSLVVTQAPYVSIPHARLGAIVDALQLDEGSALYDLGCGDARVLRAAAKRVPGARYTGIENALFPYLVSRMCYSVCRTPIIVVRQNFFDTDVSRATHVFTYLFPELMDALLPKLEKELPAGARLVSCDFSFSNKSPIETKVIAQGKWLGTKLFIYEF